MSLITDEYKKLNEQLHSTNKAYGTSGHKWANAIKMLSEKLGTQDILDYGCGKSTLANNLPFDIKQYDPAVEKHSKSPEQADIVVCTDVLEHIEPDCLIAVLDHIASLAKKAVFLVIHGGAAQKTLADGRNAHLIQECEAWWLTMLFPRFRITQFASSLPIEPVDTQPVLEYVIAGIPLHREQSK